MELILHTNKTKSLLLVHYMHLLSEEVFFLEKQCYNMDLHRRKKFPLKLSLRRLPETKLQAGCDVITWRLLWPASSSPACA